ncbi:probable serine hydrolase isoform X2 [Bacillus rossius redtenbacheri]|uniref:probable serine hydrolase isoform X2 n=1 Tax=Bacillus rossius redtenbacheri TaxID=93214 RepID=UPI002FDD0E38
MLICRKLQHVKQAHSLLSRLYTQAATAQQNHRPVQEIVIPVPWGHIAGKWWGPTDVKPILCLHGWQDNAGTWDALAPLLPPDVSMLAMDFPGHGLSSHYPPGQPYYQIDYLAFVRRIVRHFGWDQVSLMGHSMGSIVSFMYSCTFPGEVTSYIGIDALQPQTIPPEIVLKWRGYELDKVLETLTLDIKNRPAYSYDEAISIYEKGTHGSLTRASCEILMKRGTVKHEDGRYSFNRDLRLKHSIVTGWPPKNILLFAASIDCNVLHIKAKSGLVYSDSKITRETLDALKNSAKYFEHHDVEGTHHVHVNNPERVAPLITQFLQKCVL